MKKVDYRKFTISLGLPQLAGLIGSLFTAPAISIWYSNLTKPSFSPPDSVFGPVWITLYILMGISVYRVWRQTEREEESKKAVRFFWIHLVFNSVWSILFFGAQNPGLALVEIVSLLILIIWITLLFKRIDKWAGALMVPYVLWVSFAVVLNYFIWLLN